MRHHAFIISLERAPLRFAHATAMLETLPISGEIFPAVDGSKMSTSSIQAVYQKGLHRPNYPFELGTGEIGCFLSHRNVWKLIVDRKLDAALILEDDVCIDQAVFFDAVDFAGTACPAGGYVQFPVRPVVSGGQQIVTNGPHSLLTPKVTPLRTSGQWVTREAAEQLLAITHRFDRPVDSFLQMHWLTQIRLSTIFPSGITDMTQDLGGSTIGASKVRRIDMQKVYREVNRAVYRWRISRLSSRRGC